MKPSLQIYYTGLYSLFQTPVRFFQLLIIHASSKLPESPAHECFGLPILALTNYL